MKTQFTPGPWKSTGRRIEQADDKGLLAIVSERPFAHCGTFSAEQMLANARAIAALPDLVAALTDLLAESPNRTPAGDAARAALAKVKG